MRDYTKYADETAISFLDALLHADTTDKYKQQMTKLGSKLAEKILSDIKTSSTLLASTAEDADYLGSGVQSTLAAHNIKAFRAVFWNNHYIPEGCVKSVAPIVHSFYESGYASADTLIIMKSIISGSCVVRTNLIDLIDKNNFENIFILSPVMHVNAEEKIREAFPKAISDKFQIITFAKDSNRKPSGEVEPGIGGDIYELLGLNGQPVHSGYMPQVVQAAL